MDWSIGGSACARRASAIAADAAAVVAREKAVGSALAWFDASYECGELEPVGVAPTHRGRGLAAAMLRFALARLREAGASHAVVGARGDDDYPVPRRVYASVGFDLVSTQRVVARG